MQTEYAPHDTTSPTLTGIWHTLARITWVIVFALVIVVFVTILPRYYQLNVSGTVDFVSTQFEFLDLSQLPLTKVTLSVVVLWGAMASVYMVVAVLIFWRGSHNRFALIVSIWLASYGAIVTLQGSPQVLLLELHPVLEFLTLAIHVLGWTGLMTVGFIFPDGRFTPRWGLPFYFLSLAFNFAWYAPASSPLYPLNWGPGLSTLGLLIAVGGPLLVQIVRYRSYASPRQRQQMKWVVIGLAFTVAGLFLTSGMQFIGGVIQGSGGSVLPVLIIIQVMLFVTLTSIPISFAMAILHGNLWDVNIVINRSLVYGGMTILLALVFGGLFIGLNAGLGLFFDGNLTVVPAVFATAAVVGLFNPARKGLRQFVDRRIYGIGLDYTHAVVSKVDVQHTTDTTDADIGTYTNIRMLARGGMGKVFIGQDPHLNRNVAIKVLSDQFTGDVDIEQRFLREAQTTAQLKHPNIVDIYDMGESGGRIYIAMEYIDGHDWGAIIKQHGPLSLTDALPRLHEVAAALDHAHQHNVVHRDVKPSNIMIERITASNNSQTERAVLMDFGIAKLASAMTALTGTNQMIGTLDYISPEQIQCAGNVDYRADIYSFGVTVYYLLTGQLPFKKQNPGALVMAHLMQPAPDPRDDNPQVPGNAAAAIMQAMAKTPDKRFNSVGEMVNSLSS